MYDNRIKFFISIINRDINLLVISLLTYSKKMGFDLYPEEIFENYVEHRLWIIQEGFKKLKRYCLEIYTESQGSAFVDTLDFCIEKMDEFRL